jgi:hypothetical protein
MGTPSASTAPEPDRLRDLAQALDCLTEGDLCLLANVTASTCDNWRRRGNGPSYILIGNRYLYPRKAVAEHMQGLLRERGTAGGKAVL